MSTRTFSSLGLPDDLVEVLASGGITDPFPIQSAVIPDALAGRDIAGRAPTGSGKTLAFGLPIMARLPKGSSTKPRALILAPTRELADQIKRDLVPLARVRRRYVAAVYGGVGYGPQIEKMRRGVDVLVACPGRLLDLMEQRHVDLSEVDVVVIDEADRMADMGFMPDVRRILDRTPQYRTTWLFSATLDGDVALLAKRYQKDPVRHSVGHASDDHGNARHHFWRVGARQRIPYSAEIIRDASPAIVFCRTRRGVDRVANHLHTEGIRVAAIHGGRSQGQRARALRAFVEGRIQALIATDVAARGIHVEGVATVIHFDPAEDAKAYLHRSGRTARAGASGIVVSLVVDAHTGTIKNLQRALGLRNEAGAPDLDTLRSGGERLDANTTVRPKTRPVPRPKHHAGKKGRRRSNKPRPQFWD